MRSVAVLAFVTVAVCGVVGTTVVAASDDRDLAFTLGVMPGLVAAELAPGSEACQTPVTVGEAFDGLRTQIGTYERRGQPLEVSVRRIGGEVLARGRLPGRYDDISQPHIALGTTVARDERVAVCFRNVGTRKVALYGGPELAKRGSTVTVGGRDTATDLTLLFTRPSRSALAQVPDVFERASLFRPAWIGPWVFWLLGGLVLIGVPGLVALALRDAFGDETR